MSTPLLPVSPWRSAAAALLALPSEAEGLAERMHVLARALVGRPYLADALIGGPDEPEQMVLDLSGFDCVTLVENVLALARAEDLPGYVRELRQLRYRDGQIHWLARLHYFSDWLAHHQRREVLSLDTEGPGARELDTELSSLAGYPQRRTRIWVVPRQELLAAAPRIQDGAVVAFASTRRRIDYFHVGLLFWETGEREEHERLVLYHAGRSSGAVVAEPLGRFLGRNRMRGLSFATPL